MTRPAFVHGQIGLHATEASTLGLRPGEWPRAFTFDGRYQLPEGWPEHSTRATVAVHHAKTDGDGDLMWVDYQVVGKPGLFLRVFND